MSKINVNEIGTQSGTDVAISSGKTISGTASQFKMTDLVAGDILYASAADTLGRVAKGAASEVLTMNAGATAPEFAAASGAGKVGQVVSTILTSGLSTTSTSPTDLTGLAATITPAETSSKILIIANGMASHAAGYGRVYFKLSGGNTATYIGDAATGHEGATGLTPSERADYSLSNWVMSYLDSPSTTSATTYQVVWWTDTSTAWVNRPAVQDVNGLNGASTITVLEILA